MSGWSDLARRWSGRGGTVAFVLAALALARVVGDEYPAAGEHYAAPHVVEATLGEPAELRLATVTAQAPRAAAEVRGPIEVYQTSGVWVVVDITFTPTTEDTGLRYAEIVDSAGRSYTTTRAETNSCMLTQPLVTTECAVALELPAEAVPGATLRLAADEFRTSYDDLLEVELGLDEADTAAVDDAPIVLRQPVRAGWR